MTREVKKYEFEGSKPQRELAKIFGKYTSEFLINEASKYLGEENKKQNV